MAAPKDFTALDYLLQKGGSDAADDAASDSPPQLSPAAETALHAAAAGQVLATAAAIEKEKGGDHPGALLSEIDQQLQLGAELLLPVARLLTSAGLVEVTERRPFDDNCVTVTDDGHALTAPGQQLELFRRLDLTA